MLHLCAFLSFNSCWTPMGRQCAFLYTILCGLQPPRTRMKTENLDSWKRIRFRQLSPRPAIQMTNAELAAETFGVQTPKHAKKTLQSQTFGGHNFFDTYFQILVKTFWKVTFFRQTPKKTNIFQHQNDQGLCLCPARSCCLAGVFGTCGALVAVRPGG